MLLDSYILQKIQNKNDFKISQSPCIKVINVVQNIAKKYLHAVYQKYTIAYFTSKYLIFKIQHLLSKA
jgi:hypothetical protein